MFVFASMVLVLAMSANLGADITEGFRPFSAVVGLWTLLLLAQYALQYRKTGGADGRAFIRLFFWVLGVRAAFMFAAVAFDYPVGLALMLCGVVAGWVMPGLMTRGMRGVPINFPHLTERLSLLVIITPGETIVGIAPYFLLEIMIGRDASEFVRKNAEWFPVVAVTGPRQSGKSTLVRALFPDYAYVNLEDESDFNLAAAGPTDFIKERPGRMVIDEAQRLPALFDAIQVASDERGSSGQYVLSGSQNFLLTKGVSQSLAGRVGTVRLLPLSYKEVESSGFTSSPDSLMLNGGYPRLYASDIPAPVFYRNYLETYVQRDVSGYVEPRNLATFRKLLVLCAQCAGSLVNVSRLAADAGVARATVDSWLSLLEASYVVFRLPPYFANVRKRLTKTPKLYFYDTGLLCHLLGVETAEQLRDSPARGTVFENLIIGETMKRHLNAGGEPRLFFYRDDNKVEVDLVDFTDGSAPELAGIKSAMTFQPGFVKSLGVVGDDLGIPMEQRNVVMRCEQSTRVPQARVWSAKDWLLR